MHILRRIDAVREGLASRSLRRLHLTSLGYNTVEYAVIVALAVVAFDAGGAGAVGVITVVRTLPALLAGPVLSVAVDRWSRSAVLASGLAVRTVTVVVLGVAIVGGEFGWVVYMLAAVDAMVASAFYPAYVALMPELARSPAELSTSNALASTMENLGTLLGPAIAAGLLIVSDPPFVFFGAAVVLLASALLAARLATARRPPAARGLESHFLRELTEGLAAVRRNPGAGVVVGGWAFESVLVGMSEVLIVVVAFDVIGWGDAGVGWLNALLGVGGLAGSIAMAALARSRPFGLYMAVGTVAFGLAFAGIGAAPWALMAVAAHVAMGIGAAQVDVAAMTLLQRVVPDDELGRVFGAFEGIYWGALGVGAALASWAVLQFGVRTTLLLAGSVAGVVGLAILGRLRRVDALVDVPEARLDLLKTVPLFCALPVPTLERLARCMVDRPVEAGEVLMHEGESGTSMFVVAAGELAVSVAGERVAALGPGEVVGEIAPLQGVERTATVRATTDGDLHELDGVTFIEAVCGHSISTERVEDLVDARVGQLRRIRARTGR